MAPNDLVASLLVLSNLPTFPMDNRISADQKTRMQMIAKAMEEVLKIRTE